MKKVEAMSGRMLGAAAIKVVADDETGDLKSATMFRAFAEGLLASDPIARSIEAEEAHEAASGFSYRVSMARHSWSLVVNHPSGTI
nr:hypothetical protein [Methylobacterium sp. BTF04]